MGELGYVALLPISEEISDWFLVFLQKKHLLLCVLAFDFSQTVFWEGGGIKKKNKTKKHAIFSEFYSFKVMFKWIV